MKPKKKHDWFFWTVLFINLAAAALNFHYKTWAIGTLALLCGVLLLLMLIRNRI